MEGETGGKGAIGFKGTEGRVGDPGLTGVKVHALFSFEIKDHFVKVFMCITLTVLLFLWLYQ